MLGCYTVRDVSLSPGPQRKVTSFGIVEGPLSCTHKYTEVKMNSRRKVSPEAEKVFNKYTKSPLVRRLNSDEACEMFQKEFGVLENQSLLFFKHFDADRNGQLSLWEFQHFYNVSGPRTEEIMKKFNELNKTNADFLTKEETLNLLPVLADEFGKTFDDKDIELFTKSTFGKAENDAEAKLTLLQFIDLLARIKMYQTNSHK